MMMQSAMLVTANVDYFSGMNLLSDQQFEKGVMTRALEKQMCMLTLFSCKTITNQCKI